MKLLSILKKVKAKLTRHHVSVEEKRESQRPPNVVVGTEYGRFHGEVELPSLKPK